MPKTVRDLVTSPMTPLSFQLQATVPSSGSARKPSLSFLRECFVEPMTRVPALRRGARNNVSKCSYVEWHGYKSRTLSSQVELMPARSQQSSANTVGTSRCGLSSSLSPSSSSAVLLSCRWAANSRHGMRGTSWTCLMLFNNFCAVLISPIAPCLPSRTPKVWYSNMVV